MGYASCKPADALVFVCLVFLGYCYFMLSVLVQLIAWEGHPRNDLLCVERDVKQLLTHSLTNSMCVSMDLQCSWFSQLISEIVFNCSHLVISPPLPSNRHHRSCGDRLEGKGENYPVCSVQYCVQQLCTVRCTHI